MLASCDLIHEFPESGKEVDPTKISAKIVVSSRKAFDGVDIITKSDASDYNRRFIVCLRANEFTDSVVYHNVVYRNADDTTAFTLTAELHARKYKLVVWMDYVLKDSGNDLYYYTGNGTALDAIHLPSKTLYVAGDDHKDTQTITKDVDLTQYAGQWYTEVTIPAPVERPMAKVTCLASDIDKYAESIGYVGKYEDLAKTFTIDVTYNGYFPSGFNAWTGRLNDSEIGYGYKADAYYPTLLKGSNYTSVGSDYIFVNGQSSSVNVSVLIRTKDGKFINEVTNINVPITRGRETVVIHKFLTKDYVPGIGINPQFEGEFDVYVNV